MPNDTTASAPQLVFVGGAPRSGTTLVQRPLGAHSQIYSGPELSHIPPIVLLRNAMVASVRRGHISNAEVAAIDATIADHLLLARYHPPSGSTGFSPRNSRSKKAAGPEILMAGREFSTAIT